MNTITKFLLASALVASADSAFAITPSSMSSMQPFQEFAPGTGEGYARTYKDRSKADFVAILRDPTLASAEMRVDCGKLVSQMAEGHDLPFEGCEGAANAIESDDAYAVVACEDAVFSRSYVSVTNREGTGFGVWPRTRACYRGEKVLTYNGKYVLSLRCLNPVFPGEVRKAAVPAPPVAYVPAPEEDLVDPFADRKGCEVGPANGKYLAVHMMEPRAAQNACAVKYMLPRDGNLGPGKEGQTPQTWGEDTKFSKECYEDMHSGEYAYGAETHELQVAAVKDGKKRPIFKGTVTGDTMTAGSFGGDRLVYNNKILSIPEVYAHGYEIVAFLSGGPRFTPTDSGIGKPVDTFNIDKDGNPVTCNATVFTGIDAETDAPAPATATDGVKNGLTMGQ